MSLRFVQPTGSARSQQSTNRPYPKPDESSPHPLILFL